jgi:hypothetical protein
VVFTEVAEHAAEQVAEGFRGSTLTVRSLASYVLIGGLLVSGVPTVGLLSGHVFVGNILVSDDIAVSLLLASYVLADSLVRYRRC